MKKLNPEQCTSALLPIRDALDVVSGKWKLLIIISISRGNNRFTQIKKSIPKLSSKVLAKELKDLEEHRLIKRTVYDDTPVLIKYTLLPHAKTLDEVIEALRVWGLKHREKVMES